MPSVEVPIGQEDKFWVGYTGGATDHTRTLRWKSSGDAIRNGVRLDQRPTLDTYGSMTGPSALSTDDTTTYARMDNVGFEGATRDPGPPAGVPGSGFRMGVIASADQPATLPPATEVAEMTATAVVVARTASGGGNLESKFYTGTSSSNSTTQSVSTPLSTGWQRYRLALPGLSHTTSQMSTYEQTRTRVGLGQMHAHVYSYDLNVIEVAYIGLELAWVLLRSMPSPSPRRVFPREDGLAGGGRRVWPPPKSAQYGKRPGPGGYL